MNIVVRELYANKKSLIVWGGSMAAFVAMMFMEFAAYYQNPEMLAVIEAMPREMLEAFGMANANLTTVSGYLSVAMVFINVTLAVYATMLGNNLVAKEERDKTAAFLLTMPIGRPRVLAGKIAAGIICSLILLGITAGSMYLAILPYEVDADFARFATLLMVTSFMQMLLFLCLGVALGAVTRRHKLSAGLGMGTVFALYLASILSGLTASMEFLRYISPFEFFEAAALMRDLRIEPLFAIITLSVTASCLACAFRIYSGRDIYV